MVPVLMKVSPHKVMLRAEMVMNSIPSTNPSAKGAMVIVVSCTPGSRVIVSGSNAKSTPLVAVPVYVRYEIDVSAVSPRVEKNVGGSTSFVDGAVSVDGFNLNFNEV